MVTPEERARYVAARAEHEALRRLRDAHRDEYDRIHATTRREASAAWDRMTDGGARPSTTPRPPEPLTYRIRRWAAIHGVACPKVGRLPRAVIAAWNEAHPDEQVPVTGPPPPPVRVPRLPRPPRPPSFVEFARAAGMECPAAGRVPNAVVVAWRAAYPDAPRTRSENRIAREDAVKRTGWPTTPNVPRPTPTTPPPAAQPPPRATPTPGPPRPPTATSGAFPAPPPPTPERRCADCGNLLSRYNPDLRCSSCTVRAEATRRYAEPADDLDAFDDDEDDTPIHAQPVRPGRSGDYDHPQRTHPKAVPRPHGAVVLSDGTVNPLTSGTSRPRQRGPDHLRRVRRLHVGDARLRL